MMIKKIILRNYGIRKITLTGEVVGRFKKYKYNRILQRKILEI